MTRAVDRIRRAIARNRKERLTALLHHINVKALRRAYLGLRRDAAPGIDGERWEEYGAKLEERLLDLQSRAHRGAYRAPPVSARPLQLGTAETDGRVALAVREDPSPVASATVPLAGHTQGRSRVP